MYFLVSGHAVARFDGKEFDIPVGAFFGQVSLLRKSFREVTVFTKTECKIMSLETRDFEHVLVMKPELQSRLEEEVRLHLDEYVERGELQPSVRDEILAENKEWMDRVTKTI